MKTSCRSLLLAISFALSLALPLQSRGEVSLPKSGICAYGNFLPDIPENTMPAFEEAARLGVQMIAMDVHLTKDGEVVVIKDETVDRTTNGKGRVDQMTLAEIQNLHAGPHHGDAFLGIRIPTLRSVLEAMPATIWMECRLNGEKEIAEKTMKIVKDLGRQAQTILSCDREQARAAAKVDPKALICNMQQRSNQDDYIEASIKNRYAYVFWKGSKERLSNAAEGIRKLKENGIGVIYYHSAVTPAIVQSLFSEGADFIQASQNLQRFIEAAGNAKGGVDASSR